MYRPITCSWAMYKVATQIIARLFSSHLEEHSLLPAEQKGWHFGSIGCEDQLLISKTIFEDYRDISKTLIIEWIDYEKAFDSVPHNWTEKAIELIGVNNKIVKLCELSMKKWITQLQQKINNGLMQSRSVMMNIRIFQGVSPSLRSIDSRIKRIEMWAPSIWNWKGNKSFAIIDYQNMIGRTEGD
jgi:hypothetical protein